MAVDESQVTGWYKFMMTCKPESKLIHTETTKHAFCLSIVLYQHTRYLLVFMVVQKNDLSNTKHKTAFNLWWLMHL